MTRRAKPTPSFSLFPFLAVLLCTMASLVVLLLILVNQGRLAAAAQQQSAAATPSYDAPAAEELAAQQAEQQQLAAAAEQLRGLRQQLADKFQTAQFDLSHLEDHVRRLHDQIAALEADYHVLKQSRATESETRQEKQARLSDLTRKIAASRAELADAQLLAASRPRSFAIIPYDGPNGTHRRPIYIECCKDKIILQPEGAILLPGDFRPPIDAGNPLAAALRATREYLVTTGSLQGGEPYPLLLVRPDGAEMYTAARNAMQSWSTEYGYELIDADMQLELPPADEALGEVVRKTVDVARQRNLALALRRGGLDVGSGSGGPVRGGPARSYTASPTSSGDAPYAVASRDGGFQVHGERSDPLLDHRLGPAGGHAQGGALPSVGNIRNGQTGGLGGSGTGSGSGAPQPTSGGFYPPERPRGSLAQQQPPLQGTQTSGNTQPQAGPTRLSQPNARTAVTGAPYANNNPFAPGDTAGATPDGTSMTSRGTQMPAGGASGRMGSNTADEQQLTEREYCALADARGDNWALPNSSRGATPYTRPIRIECHADKLVVMPDRGTTGVAKTVPLGGPLEGSVDTLVGHLWQHMKGWGMAGPQAYWKPLLSVHVAPGGEDRFAELAALMQRSGVDVEWKR